MAVELLKWLFIVFLTIVFEKISKQIKLNKEVKNLRFVFPFSTKNREFSVKCSLKKEHDGKNPPTLRTYVHSAEVLALQKISKMFHGKPVKIKFDSFYSTPQENQNLLLIGTAAYNEISDQFMKNMGNLSFCKPQDSHAYFILDNKKYGCDHSEHNEKRVTIDYGVILRKPYGDDNIVLLVGGIHMHGTLAATEVALSKKFQDKVKDSKYNYFAQLVKTEVSSDGLSLLPNSNIWEEYQLIELN